MKIFITDKAFLKLKYYTEAVNSEISGLGRVREIPFEKGYEDEEWDEKKQEYVPALRLDPRVNLEIYDLEVLPQTASAGHASMDQEDLGKFLNQRLMNKESVKDYKVWWHSHCYLESYFSYIDESTIDQSHEFPYLVSLVTNKNGDTKVRFDLFKPIRIVLDNLKLYRVPNEDHTLQTSCEQEAKKMIKKHKLFHGFTTNRL